MTTLAHARFGVFDGLGSPSAGGIAGKLKGALLSEFGRLKVDTATASAAFNDLHALAHEHGITVEQSKVFSLAKMFLLAMPRELSQPELDFDADGEVLFDWRGPHERMMTISLREDGRISFAARRSAVDSDNGKRHFKDAIPSDIVQLVQKTTEP